MSRYRPLSQTLPSNIAFPPSASRTPPPSPKRVPPSSPTKRRRFLKESEDNSGDLLIEQYIYRTDPYRSTSAAFPFPMPLILEPTDESMMQRLQAVSGLRELVASTISGHNIEPQSITANKQSKPGYPAGGDIAVPVIRVCIDVLDNASTDSWSAARRDTKALLAERGLDDWEVEFIDPKRFYQPSLFAVSPADPLVTIYEAKRDAILQIVEDALGGAWTSMSFFNVGRTSLKTQHAIVIMVRPLTEHDWLVLRWRIENEVNDLDANADHKITVEFMPGFWEELPPTPLSRPGQRGKLGISSSQSFDSNPKMGTSIGIFGEEGAGTLGGFFALECYGKRHLGFLTNSHVVQPSDTAPELVQKEYHSYGCQYSYPDNHPSRSEVRYFAGSDVKATLADVETRLRGNAKFLAKVEKDIEERKALDKSIENLLVDRRRAIATTDELEEIEAVLDSMPRTLGKVLCASGKAVTESKNRIIDWAFVEVPEQIQKQFSGREGNRLPARNAQGMLNNGPRNYGFDREYFPSTRPERFSSVMKGEWYFKIGRTTGITTGVCNGTQTTFKLNDTPLRYVHDKSGMVARIVTLSEKIINELVIVNSKNLYDMNHSQDTFCRAGDSGSVLIDATGNVAGLVFGSMTGLCSPLQGEQGNQTYVEAGLVTDIQDVLASIAARTTPHSRKGEPNGPPGKLSTI